MANKKPSALTAATALDGTEIFHGVQSGNSRKVTGNQVKTLALGPFGSNGLVARTGAEVFSARTITGPAAGITVSNGDGIAGNPTLALANDLSALEGLGSTGIAVRTAADTWAQRTIAAGNGISITNGDGVSGNPTIAVNSGEILIEEFAGDGMTGTKTFSAIPATYRALRLMWEVRSSAAATAVNLTIQINGDSGANYDLQNLTGTGAATSAAQSIAGTSAAFATVSADSGPSGEAGGGNLVFPYYAGTTFRKNLHATSHHKTADSAGGLGVRVSTVVWRSTAAVSSITIALTSGNFMTGSKLVLFGVV